MSILSGNLGDETMNSYTDSALSDEIQNFLKIFKIDDKYKYVDLIDSSAMDSFVVLDVNDLVSEKTRNGDFFEELLDENPQRFLKAANRAVNQIFSQRFPDNHVHIAVHLKNIQRNISVNESLTSNNIGKPVSIKAMIVGKFEIFNDLIQGIYLCEDGHEITTTQVEGMGAITPTICQNPNCKSRQFELLPEKSSFCTARFITIKSQDDFAIADESLKVKLTSELINTAEVGDVVEVVGIIKIDQSIKQVKSGIYKNYMLANSLYPLISNDEQITSSDIEFFKSLPNSDGFYKKMTNSVASSVSGLSQIKESILLQQIGSPDIVKKDGKTIRGQIHIGLWGHGGLAKSRLGEWLETNFPKVKMVHSMGATGKGLLLGIEDNEIGGKSLHAGAFVYCNNGGTVILDEYTRLPAEVKAELMTTLESGYASIAKSGFQAKVLANAGLIATGNAKQGEWDKDDSLLENLDSTSPELQRFDLHWIVLDPNNTQVDQSVADAILYDVKYTQEERPLEPAKLIKYIQFVRQIDPVLTDIVKEHLKDAYVKLRKENKNSSISPRNLNTLVRLTLASARLHQRRECDVVDADNAISLMKQMFEGQNISISEANTYISRQVPRAIKILKGAEKEGLNSNELFSELKNSGTDEEKSQFILDLGILPQIRDNFKWRNTIDKLKRNTLVKVLQEKPLQLAYNYDAESLNNWLA